jgi:hypothetical protein
LAAENAENAERPDSFSPPYQGGVRGRLFLSLSEMRLNHEVHEEHEDDADKSTHGFFSAGYVASVANLS